MLTAPTPPITSDQPGRRVAARHQEETRVMENVKDYRVVVIGSGPAGCTAALYLARANIVPVVLEGLQPGGQLTITTDVENYPGFPEGVLGPKLMDLMRQQAERFGASFVFEVVDSVDFSSRPFRVTTDQKIYECEAVVVASGASAKQIGLESEKELQGFGVSYCATCDGFFFKDKEIVVVGGGDSAVEEATFLTKFAKKVTLVHRRDELRASKIMQQRAFDNPKVEFIWDSTVTEVIGSRENGVTALKLENVKTGEVTKVATQGLFVAIGHTPNTAPYQGKLDVDDKGYIVVRPDSTYTSVEGVFACGDVTDHVYRQAVTAAGSGCRAALDCERWLAEQEYSEASASGVSSENHGG